MTGGPSTPSPPPSARLMRLAVAGSAALAVAAGALFYYASQQAPRAPTTTAYRVTVGDKTCDPNNFTVPAGRAAFEIYNASNRTLEWEILDGVMVVEERENITPGLRATITTRLKPGRYEITCGLLSNPRGTLIVTASAESEAERQKPPVKAFVGPLSEYRVYLVLQSSALTKAVDQLSDAIRAGDLDGARKAYLAARLVYRRLDPVIGRFSDLKNAIDPLAVYLAERENDPAFTGFHRIEYGLFVKNTLEDLTAAAEKLAADIAALNARVRALRLAPEDLAASVERQARFLADGEIRKGGHYAGNELSEFAASFEGMEKSVDLLRPLLEGAAPDVVEAIGRARAGVHAILDGLKQDQSGYPTYERVDDAAREKLAKAFAAFADAAGRINSSLGLE